jgi:asparagine synthase (glutamine-hydrolysing)
MSNEDDTVWVSYNGEIYNSPDLRRELLGRGHRFRSTTDTEVIVHLFEDEGIDCVRRLDGMFACAIFDQKQDTLFLVKDRLGIKPLYYHANDRSLIFASEIKALVKHPEVPRDLDPIALGQYLTFRTTVPPRTMFRGINKLPAACTLSCERGRPLAVGSYWDAFSPSTAPSIDMGDERAVATRVRDLLREAVRKMLLADVPLGAFLSGGLDSSSIVGLMAEVSDRPVETFTIRWKDREEFNEGAFPDLISRRFRARSHEITLDHLSVADSLRQLVVTLDEPLADAVSLPLRFLSAGTRALGTKVVLVGEGSDEIFLGYESRVQAIRAYSRRWRWLQRMPRSARVGLHAAAHRLHRLTGLGGGVSEKLRRLADGDELFYGSLAFSEARKAKLLPSTDGGGDSQALLRAYARELFVQKPSADFVDKVINLDLRLRLAELLLPRVDRTTMAHGLEARVPFLDHRLVELAVRIPARQKIVRGEGKHILKRAMADLLPPEILRRPKKPFGVPLAPWLRGELAGFARETILSSRLRDRDLLDYSFVAKLLDEHQAGASREVEIWTLLTLCAWHDQWM